jgi:hypothetical protein
MMRKIWLATLVVVFICPLLTLAQDEATAAITVETELCTGVEERMPVGMADQFPADVGQVCLWSKVLGCTEETTIKHVWYYRGDEMATVELPVRGSAWRTYSYKTIPPRWSGDWVVKVIDADGNVLKAIPFKVGADFAKEDLEPAIEKVTAEVKTEIKEAEAEVKKAVTEEKDEATEKATDVTEKVKEKIEEAIDTAKTGQ